MSIFPPKSAEVPKEKVKDTSVRPLVSLNDFLLKSPLHDLNRVESLVTNMSVCQLGLGTLFRFHLQWTKIKVLLVLTHEFDCLPLAIPLVCQVEIHLCTLIHLSEYSCRCKCISAAAHHGKKQQLTTEVSNIVEKLDHATLEQIEMLHSFDKLFGQCQRYYFNFKISASADTVKWTNGRMEGKQKAGFTQMLLILRSPRWQCRLVLGKHSTGVYVRLSILHSFRSYSISPSPYVLTFM